MVELSKKKISLVIGLIFVISLCISLPGIQSTGPIHPDGQRYAFNGVLVYDWLQEGHIFNPFEYASDFYAHYPATNLPYGPPFFAALFACSYWILGIGFYSVRIVISLFVFGAAAIYWYSIYKIEKRLSFSIIALLFFLTNSLFIEYSRDIAAELPAIFFYVLVVYLLYQYVEKGSRYYLILCAFAFGFGYLTKQYLLPLAVVIPIYIWVSKGFNKLFRVEVIFSLCIIIVFTVPYTILSLQYFSSELGNSSGVHMDWGLTKKYLQLSLRNLSFGIPFIIHGLIIGLRSRNKLVVLWIIWLFCWYLFFVVIYGYFVPRYFFLLLARIWLLFCIVCVLFVNEVKNRFIEVFFNRFIMPFMLFRAATYPVYYVRGYEEAGKYVAQNIKGKVVLYYGNYDGAFLFGVRRYVKKDKIYVLRGDRHLANRLWWGEVKDKESIKSISEINQFLEYNKVSYVVIEKDMPGADHYLEYQNLREVLKNGDRFILTKKIQIETNYKKLGSEIFVYRDNHESIEGHAIELKIPASGLEEDIEIQINN